MLPYEIGDSVTMLLGERSLTGRVTAVSAQSIEVTVPLSLNVGHERAILRWPGSLEQPIELATTPHQTQLVLRLPLERVPVPTAFHKPIPPESMLSHSPGEMRRSIRVPLELVVQLVDLATHEQFEAQTCDLSGGGARLASARPLIVGREYELRLMVGSEAVTLRARVLRRLKAESYALKFLCEREVGHRLMRSLFAHLRGEAPPARVTRMNFRRP